MKHKLLENICNAIMIGQWMENIRWAWAMCAGAQVLGDIELGNFPSQCCGDIGENYSSFLEVEKVMSEGIDCP